VTNFLQDGVYDDDDDESVDSPQHFEFSGFSLQEVVPTLSPMVSASRPMLSARGIEVPDKPARRGANNFSANGAPEIDPTGSEKADTPPFLIGEEASNEVGLSDGKKIFIDDVLETAEWCVEMRCFIFAQNKPFDQGSHTRVTKQLSLHSPERVHHRVCRQMGRPCARAFYFHC
jgi:hypothetical protein